MTTVEALFKVGENAADVAANPRSAFRDGAVITIRPLGYAWGPAAVDDYLTNGTPPPNWSDLADHEQEIIKRIFDRTVAASNATVQQIADIRYPGWDQLDASLQAHYLDLSQGVIDEANIFLLDWSTLGFDTNWGKADLMTHGVILLDLTGDQILRYFLEVQQRPFAPGLNVFQRRQDGASSRWRVKYEALFSAQRIANLQDPSVLVPVPRGMVPLTPAQALENITLVNATPEPNLEPAPP